MKNLLQGASTIKCLIKDYDKFVVIYLATFSRFLVISRNIKKRKWPEIIPTSKLFSGSNVSYRKAYYSLVVNIFMTNEWWYPQKERTKHATSGKSSKTVAISTSWIETSSLEFFLMWIVSLESLLMWTVFKESPVFTLK